MSRPGLAARQVPHDEHDHEQDQHTVEKDRSKVVTWAKGHGWLLS